MVKKQSGGDFKDQKHQRGGNFNGKKHQQSGKQKGGGAGIALAAGLAIPAILGAATKILPGIFGKKKAAPVTNHNYNGQRQQRQQQQQQQYRQPQYRQPQYRQPQYRQPPQYYQTQTQPYYFRQPRRQPPPQPYRRRRRYTRQKGGRVSRPERRYYKV
jgi:hypothetical protein